MDDQEEEVVLIKNDDDGSGEINCTNRPRKLYPVTNRYERELENAGRPTGDRSWK